jgi:hypothetical protein
MAGGGARAGGRPADPENALRIIWQSPHSASRWRCSWCSRTPRASPAAPSAWPSSPGPSRALQGEAFAFNISIWHSPARWCWRSTCCLNISLRSPVGPRLARRSRRRGRRPGAGQESCPAALQAFALGGAIMALAGAVQAHFIGFIAPGNYLPMMTFQVWAMLIVGGSGNNRGAILGAVLVWAIWALSGADLRDLSRRPAGPRRIIADRHHRRHALHHSSVAAAGHPARNPLCLASPWTPQQGH